MEKNLEDKKEFLFSYGTLQQEKVQLENYGRLLIGKKTSLSNYKLDKLKITDDSVIKKSGKTIHPIAIKTGSPNDVIEGTIFEITTAELDASDEYEVDDYKRILATFNNGQKAWVYVAKKEMQETTISSNIAKIRTRINRACKQSNRDPKEIKLLLATKTVSPERIIEAYNCGEVLIAENKVQEVQQKHDSLVKLPFEHHFIGYLQTNKVKHLLKYDINCIQTIDRIKLAEKLHNRLKFEGKEMDVLIQVNTSNEDSKFGVHPEKALEFIKKISKYSTLHIKGLMTIGLFSSDNDKVRKCFKLLKAIQEKIIDEKLPNVEMKELSMGMSSDIEIAIEEGATIIRVGTAIFGERQYPDSYYWKEEE